MCTVFTETFQVNLGLPVALLMLLHIYARSLHVIRVDGSDVNMATVPKAKASLTHWPRPRPSANITGRCGARPAQLPGVPMCLHPHSM